MKTIRLAWMATHPSQYQAPLLRAIAQLPNIDLTVFYFSDFSTRDFIDPGFGKVIRWDTELLGGYRHEFLPGNGLKVDGIGFCWPIVSGMAKRLTRDSYDAVLIQGWQHYGMIHAAWLAKKAGLTVLMRCEATDHFSSSTGIMKMLREGVVQFLLNQVDKCLAIGKHNHNFYLKRQFPVKRIGSMPYCVDNDHFHGKAKTSDVAGLREQLRLEQKKPVILYASKFIARKFPDHLLEAYLQLPEPRPYLIFVGDGELRQNLQNTVEKYQLKDVRFAGFRNQAELPTFYALANIFVLPSINETWGLVVNEAMNAGCAIITTDQVGSAADLVRQGENGFVIKASDVLALNNALAECLAEDRFLYMGKQSLEIIKGWGIKENMVGLRVALGLSSKWSDCAK